MTNFYRRYAPALAAALLLVAMVAESVSAQSAGTVARMGFGARGVALGNALAADASGDASPYYNPALAPFVPRQSLEASAALMSFDRQLQYLQFSTPMQPRAGIAGGIIHAGVTGIEGRDSDGYYTQDYATNEYALFLAFGTRVGERVSIGAGLQVFRADYLEELQAINSIGIDIGVSVQATQRLQLGLVLDDLLARYSWDTSDIYGTQGRRTSDRFPTRLRGGAAYTLPAHNISIFGEYESRFTSQQHRQRIVNIIGGEPVEGVTGERLLLQESAFRAGVEWQPSEVMALRAGIDRVGQDGVESARPSAGFMIEQPLGTIVVRGEYGAVLEPYDAGLMHLISLRIFL